MGRDLSVSESCLLLLQGCKGWFFLFCLRLRHLMPYHCIVGKCKSLLRNKYPDICTMRR